MVHGIRQRPCKGRCITPYVDTAGRPGIAFHDHQLVTNFDEVKGQLRAHCWKLSSELLNKLVDSIMVFTAGSRQTSYRQSCPGPDRRLSLALNRYE